MLKGTAPLDLYCCGVEADGSVANPPELFAELGMVESGVRAIDAVNRHTVVRRHKLAPA